LLGDGKTNWTSASEKLLGEGHFNGRLMWIDVNQATLDGADFMNNAELRSRVALHPLGTTYSGNMENEVLFRGYITPRSIYTPLTLSLKGFGYGVSVVGLMKSAYDVGGAIGETQVTGSPKPLIAEGVRQSGAWGGAAAGGAIGGLASAWAGAKLVGGAGALFGVETGPGAILTGIIGAGIGGYLGYQGSDVIADMIHKNPE
jgi:hypothetical protein